MTPEQVGYVAVSATVIGIVVRLLKEDVTFLPTIASRWRPLAALALGIGAGVLDKIATGVLWREALLNGVLAAATAMAGHNVVIGSARDGREFGAPKPDSVPTAPVLPPDPPSVP